MMRKQLEEQLHQAQELQSRLNAQLESLDKRMKKVEKSIDEATVNRADHTRTAKPSVVNQAATVVAGAALGVASTELTWWLTDKLFPKSQVAIGTSGNTLDVTVAL